MSDKDDGFVVVVEVNIGHRLADNFTKGIEGYDTILPTYTGDRYVPPIFS